MNSTAKILIVEDERKVARLLKQGLEEEGYAVDVAYDGSQGEELALKREHDLLILDILLPQKDGMSVLKEIRSRHVRAPVLMLTARSSVADKVEGLEEGADDYLTKPFELEELLARVRSLLRRRQAETATVLQVADLQLDLLKRRAQRGNREIELTGKEYALLEFFMRNVNTILTRATISQEIWNYNFDTGTNVVDVYVNHLRNKIDDGFTRRLLHTVRGVGYVMKGD